MTTKLRAASFQDNAVTAAKIAADAVTNAKIADDAVQTENIASTVNLGRRNVIINGGFMISQRNAAALTATANNTYFLDRWKLYLNGSCAVSTQQMLSLDSNVTALNTATGETFNNVLSIDCTTAASLGSTDLLGIIQMIEGSTSLPLAGQTCTLSFHVKTNVTGQYYVAFKMSGSSERTYLAPYTVSSADTWEKKTITFTMDTATNLNNTASVTTGSGLQVYFGLRLGTSGQMSNTLNAWHAGNYYGKSDQVTWGTSTSDTFYISGIQLEKSSQATPFEHRSFAEELALCQRYFFQINGTGVDYATMGSGQMYGTTTYLGEFKLPVAMRVTPSFSLNNSLSTTNFMVVTSGYVRAISSVTVTGDNQYLRLNCAVTTSGTQGHGAYIQLQSGYNALWSAEL